MRTRRRLPAVCLWWLSVAMAGCAHTDNSENVATGRRSYPDQRLATPVNDRPGPYTRVHPWGLPYDPADYDARAAVIGVAEGPDGNIYVLTRCHRNSCAGRPEAPIMKFNPDGQLLGSWGAGLYEFPHNLTIDRDGHVWTTDEGNHLVRKFTADGRLLMTIGESGQAGDGPTHLTSPTAVIVAPDGSIFVTEGHDNSPTAPVARVSKWAGNGTFIDSWGKPGSAPGEFSTPHTIAIDSRGRLFVGDRNNNRIQIFDQEGHFLDLWYQFGRPSGIVITSDDRLYVADSESYDFHNPGWEKGIRIGSAKDGSVAQFIPDLEPTTVSHSGAEGIGVDSKGNIYGAVVRRRMLEKHVPGGPGGAAPDLWQPATPALAHFAHVAAAFDGAPDHRGLAVVAGMEVNTAMLHANVAAAQANDLDAMKSAVRSVLHALAPADGAAGPGLGFGVKRAAEAIAAHIEMASKAPGASDTLRQTAPTAATAARAVAARAAAINDLAMQVLASASAAVAAALVEELRAMALELDTGKDVNGNRRIDLDAAEPGLNQLEAQLYSMLEGERLPRVLR